MPTLLETLGAMFSNSDPSLERRYMNTAKQGMMARSPAAGRTGSPMAPYGDVGLSPLAAIAEASPRMLGKALGYQKELVDKSLGFSGSDVYGAIQAMSGQAGRDDDYAKGQEMAFRGLYDPATDPLTYETLGLQKLARMRGNSKAAALERQAVKFDAANQHPMAMLRGQPKAAIDEEAIRQALGSPQTEEFLRLMKRGPHGETFLPQADYHEKLLLDKEFPPSHGQPQKYFDKGNEEVTPFHHGDPIEALSNKKLTTFGDLAKARQWGPGMGPADVGPLPEPWSAKPKEVAIYPAVRERLYSELMAPPTTLTDEHSNLLLDHLGLAKPPPPLGPLPKEWRPPTLLEMLGGDIHGSQLDNGWLQNMIDQMKNRKQFP